MSVPFRIGMIGCGTVGGGVLEILRRRGDDLERLAGRPLQIRRVAVRDTQRARPELDRWVAAGAELTSDPSSITSATDVDLVVEVAGGVDQPRQWIMESLAAGHDVVTANKATLAVHGDKIFRAAHEARRSVYYEASVAAAIPIVESLRSALVANRLSRLYGILNGTCNYILTRMQEEGSDYDVALAEAQERGFAEADPGLDVSGEDTAHKLALLVGLMTHSFVDAQSIPTEGITRISRSDIVFSERLGYRIRMLAVARRDGDAWDLRVHPVMLPHQEILAQVRCEFNAIQLEGDAVGPMVLYGKGAGALPTASSVVADIVRASRQEPPATDLHGLDPPERTELDQVELRNYIRMSVVDEPGILGRVTSFLGDRGISIASIHQPESESGRSVPIVVITHRVTEATLRSALDELHATGVLQTSPTRIRIEE